MKIANWFSGYGRRLRIPQRQPARLGEVRTARFSAGLISLITPDG